MIPTQQLRQHVVKLCTRHDISAAGIRGASVRSPLGYAIALHEIGYILSRRSASATAREHAAWRWAKDNALIWTSAMSRSELQSLRAAEEKAVG